MVNKLVPYNIYPNLETELMDRVFEHNPNITKEQVVAELTNISPNVGDFWTGIMRAGISKIDWEWLRVKHNMAL